MRRRSPTQASLNEIEIFLLIEVADTTLETDCKQKAPLYAKAGITDYWILDVNQRQVYVFHAPGLEGYNQQFILQKDTALSLEVV